VLRRRKSTAKAAAEIQQGDDTERYVRCVVARVEGRNEPVERPVSGPDRYGKHEGSAVQSR